MKRAISNDQRTASRGERSLARVPLVVHRALSTLKAVGSLGKSITLRQLMSHRSGLTREPPIGHYFDPTEPSLAQTIASLNHTELVYAPESRVKYFNAAIAVAGYILERTQNEPFAKYLS